MKAEMKESEKLKAVMFLLESQLEVTKSLLEGAEREHAENEATAYSLLLDSLEYVLSIITPFS